MVQVDDGSTEDRAVDGRRPSSCDHGEFDDFYRNTYHDLIKTLLIFGASLQQAEDATNAAMVDVYVHWSEIRNARPYVRRAAWTHFVRSKLRERDLFLRLRAKGLAVRDPINDDGLNVWADTRWVMEVLVMLPPAQREALALLFDGFGPVEIAQSLGKTPAAVRKNLQLARERLARELKTLGKQKRRGPAVSQPTENGDDK